ncbi:phage repressor protein C with HTH and peptisase S24 domain [Novosphingobium kunmingense]|uniref:Phage repressor protein C with HTH and peptisase S24 domain n=1 Tax=Novosphingobium kunmingense TaxID=1211806 RepID=A0A2N0HKY8_9SPHN|nr:S24 family peptidase [Novosphingobium kunmingense]PKB19633.1 phage repressor protein C with HTH and peptisase S24 domain [Novosphingobium kunmingense]
MPTEREILAERVRQRLDLLGRSPRDASIAASGKPDLIRDIFRERRMPTAPVMLELARELETTTDWLLGRSETPDQPVSEATVRDKPPEWRGTNDKDGIPVLGTGYCDDLAIEGQDGALHIERIQLELDHTVRMIHRPAALWAAREAYAIDLHGDSMEPALEQGSVRIVDPRRPPAHGDYVVAQLNDGNGGRDVVTVLVKKLVRATSTVVELQQFNPPITFRIPRSQVARLHRIVTYEELVGR